MKALIVALIALNAKCFLFNNVSDCCNKDAQTVVAKALAVASALAHDPFCAPTQQLKDLLCSVNKFSQDCFGNQHDLDNLKVCIDKLQPLFSDVHSLVDDINAGNCSAAIVDGGNTLAYLATTLIPCFINPHAQLATQ